MKKVSILSTAALAVLVAGLAWAQAARPVNRKCPVKPDVRIDPAVTVTYRGKVIGMCCTDCVDKWKKNPDAYFGKVKEDANLPVEPEGFKTAKEALEGGKAGTRIAVLFFADKGSASQGFIKVLSDPSLEAEIEKCSYAKVELKKDSDEAKQFKVTAAPTLVIIDPTAEPPKVIKSLTTGTPKGIAKELQDAVKKLEKK